MNPRLILRLVVALMAIAATAAAQTQPPDRAGEALAARQLKAAASAPFEPGKVERLLNKIETGGLFQGLFAGRDGLGIRIGGIENGAGFALGPSFRASNLFNGNLAVHASGAASIVRDRELAAGVALPHLAPGLAFTVDAARTDLAQERFFGRGMKSLNIDGTAFALHTTRVVARASVAPADWLQVSLDAGALTAAAGNGRSRRLPGIGTRFTDGDAPGLAIGTTFRVVSIGAAVDHRDVPDNPRRGGRYQVSAHRYADTLDRHSFTRIDATVEQHLSGWKRQRVLTLRTIASTSMADRGQQVPFYLQPTLGGARLLRGFVTDRFRDTTMLALQAEYGWDLSPFLNAVLFYEAGAVAPRWRDLTASDLRRDYGVGFRFGSARTVAFRTDVALGSGEGVRLSMRFNHAF